MPWLCRGFVCDARIANLGTWIGSREGLVRGMVVLIGLEIVFPDPEGLVGIVDLSIAVLEMEVEEVIGCVL